MKGLPLFLAFLISWVALQGQSKAVALHGQLQVANGQVVNAHGKAPQLRGISMSWSIWGGRKYYNREAISWLANDFKANLVRLSMAVEHEHGYLDDPSGQTNLITAAVDAAIGNGMYVIIDWHDHHAHQHQDKAVEFFTAMAKKYAGKPNVIYEIFNEPERIQWSIVKNYAIPVIEAIRKSDKQNLIIVGSPSWDQDVDLAAKYPIKGFKNIAYSFHFYASDPNHQEKLMHKADAALAAGLPLFITEWGVGESNGNGVFSLEKTDKWLKWMESNRLSWANWNLTDKEETTAILKPGASILGKWQSTDLTPAGLYIRTKLIEFSLQNTPKHKK